MAVFMVYIPPESKGMDSLNSSMQYVPALLDATETGRDEDRLTFTFKALGSAA